MQARIEKMVNDYENGRLTRRQLIAHLAAFAALGGAAGGWAVAATEPASTFRAVGLNHIALNVTDIERSRTFYVEHLGLSVSRESRSSAFLRCGEEFLALFRSNEPGLAHYCYAIEDYSVRTAAARLESKNLKPRIAGNRIYFDDPDGLEVQLASPEHRV